MGLSWNAALFLRACGLYSFLSAFFFPLCPAMVSFPHFTKVEAGSPQEAGEGLEFSRSHAGLQPSPRHGAQTLSRKGAYSCFLFSKTSLITSLSKLIHSLQSKKYNHHYHRQSSMHAFPFPPPCSELLISLLTDIPQALPAADCGTSMIPSPDVKAWGHQGFLVAAQAWPDLPRVQAFQVIPYPGLTPGSTPGLMKMQTWTRAACFGTTSVHWALPQIWQAEAWAAKAGKSV